MTTPAAPARAAPTARGWGLDLVRRGGVTGTAPHGDANRAVDGDVWTGWDGGRSDWVEFDLGAVRPVRGVKPTWGFDPERWLAAPTDVPRRYDVLLSVDGVTWTTAARCAAVDGGPRLSTFPATEARHVRFAIDRGDAAQVRMRRLEILADHPVDPPVTGLFGDNVFVLDPTMPAADLQALFDTVFAAQERDQFGTGRYAFLFTPGVYRVDARVGFSTSLLGAGLSPRDVELHSGDWVDAEWLAMNATQNFWRSAENMTYVPSGGAGRWAVSQAAPLRRIAVEGDLRLDSGRCGWASGGYLADSRVSGRVLARTQQQWFTRDSEIGTWTGARWNVVFSGVEGDVTHDGVTATLPRIPGTWPAPPVTALAHTGVVAEKPFLHLTGADVEDPAAWAVVVPEVRVGSSGTTWADGPGAGSSIPLTDFLVVEPGAPVGEINAALAAGRNVLFPPGIFEVEGTIEVTRPGTVVLGLGLATIVPTGGEIAMRVADEPGIRVAGLLFDAAETGSPALFVVGDEGVHRADPADPIVVSDVFLRVGGAVAGRTGTAMIVHADHTIVDHVWAWRGDHGEGIGWDRNTSDFGLVVNGDDVSAYGLFVEHFQKHNTVWNGERGRTVFYQNELPYDPPLSGNWRNGETRGWAAYKVSDHVREHEAWGLGSYANFWEHTPAAPFVVDNAFEAPRVAGVRLHHLLTVALGGEGVIANVVHDTGGPARGAATIPVYLEVSG